MSLQRRIERLEQRAGGDERIPGPIIYRLGETPAETLARYGLPPDFEGGIWLPEVKRVTIGGVDLRNDI